MKDTMQVRLLYLRDMYIQGEEVPKYERWKARVVLPSRYVITLPTVKERGDCSTLLDL